MKKRRKRALWRIGLVFSFAVLAAFVVMLATAPRHTDGVRGEVIANEAVTPEPTVEATATPPIPTPTPKPTPKPTPTPEPTPEPTPTLAAWTEVEPATVLISAAGDCTLGGEFNQGTAAKFRKKWEAEGADYFLANVRPVFAADDITIVNLEGPLTTSTDLRRGRAFNFKGDPDYVRILKGSSVEVCNIANNHTFDFGKAGAQETISVLEEAGIGACGYTQVCYREVNGVRVGFVGFECWEHTEKEAAQLVKKVRPECDLLIASFHWGYEYSYSSNAFQRNCGRALIDAGADLVLGHHSHVIGGVEQYKGKYIVYSLGNFCFGGNTNPEDKDTYIFQQRFRIAADGTVSDDGVRIIPCALSSSSRTNDYRPTPLSGKEYERVLKKIKKYSKVDDPVALHVE